MTIKTSIKDLLLIASGAVIFLIVLLLALHFRAGTDPAAELVMKTHRLELVSQMQVNLASASEAEKSAVQAITDEDSQMFADQAFAATAEVEQRRAELAQLLAQAGNQSENNMLAQFTTDFADFRRIDRDLLALAVKNTNIKASSLAFDSAATAVREMDAALANLAADDVKVVHLADSARIAAWRLLALIPPHIAEESQQKMDEMEAQMDKQDREVRHWLDELAAIPAIADNPDLKTAISSYGRFSEIRTKILQLSRENTNVRSLSISLNQKRKAMVACQASLTALQQAIQDEPIAGINYRNASPR